jgi:hypothetical protein
LVLSLALASLAACRADVVVGIEVEPDGSGTVEVTLDLDQEAASRLGDPSEAVRSDDLRLAGWEVGEPVPAEGGGVTLSATRQFADRDQLEMALEEVGGVDGVFRDVSLDVRDGFGRAEYEFGADVSLTGSPEQFSDPALAAELGGLPLARSPEELTAAGADDPEAITLTVTVGLPGGDPRTTGSVADRRATWTFPVTGGESTEERISVSTTAPQGRTGLLVIVAGIAAVIAVTSGVMVLLRRRA